jgi:hypothetical protein
VRADVYTHPLQLTYSGNTLSGKGVKRKMFDSLKRKTTRIIDDTLRKTGMTDVIKIDQCSIISDPRIVQLMAEHS